ncbi:succinylglutamate desuccinylase/aspartoacylase family protein [Rhodovibrionaceae bacterium A322]
MQRTTEKLPLAGNTPGTERHLLKHRYGTAGQGPKAYIQASLHADEIPALLMCHHLVRLLDEEAAQGNITGEIVILPYANPIGLSQFHNGNHSGRYDASGAGNFNRNWPDLFTLVGDELDGKLGDDEVANTTTIRQAMKSALDGLQPATDLEHLRITLAKEAYDADLLLDVHCDDESLLHLFVIPAQWPTFEDLACDLGAHAVMLCADSGGGSFDEAFSTPWTRLAERYPDNPIAPACHSATVELRGYPDVFDELALEDAEAILRTLKRRGMVAGDPGPLPKAHYVAADLAAVDSIRTDASGILAYRVSIGDQIKKGQIIAELVDPAAEDPNQARTPITSATDGLMLSRKTAKYAPSGGAVAKIVGTEPLAHRTGCLLEN